MSFYKLVNTKEEKKRKCIKKSVTKEKGEKKRVKKKGF